VTELLQRPLIRAAFFGLSGGLFAGGLMLLAFGARGIFFPPPCSAPDTAQCALEQQLLLSLARRQTLFGGLLALLAVCLFSFYRSRARRDAE
jgi:hypothetical protein